MEVFSEVTSQFICVGGTCRYRLQMSALKDRLFNFSVSAMSTKT